MKRYTKPRDDKRFYTRPSMVSLAMVLATFEWNTARGSWQADGRRYLKPSFDYLAGCGYRLSPIEQVMAGHITVEQLKLSAGDEARLNRIRQLRDLQYRPRMNRYYNKTLTDDQYRAAISSVHAELSDLGKVPRPM